MFALSEDQTMIRDLARELAQAELKQYAAEVDEQVRYPTESIAALAEAGLLGTIVPEEFGGVGLDVLSHILVVEEAAKACASTAALLNETATVEQVLVQFGTQIQKETILPQLAAGLMASVAIGEGDADASLCDVQATAAEKNDGYVLNGAKCYVQNAGHSDFYLTAAMVQGKGLTVFLVQKENTGLGFGALSPKMGQRACVAGKVTLENCRVAADAVVGTVGGGSEVIAVVENYLALGSAAQGVGLAQGAMDTAIQYVNERVQFGKRISQFENTQQVMAFVQAKVEAARALLWAAAQGAMNQTECAMAKVVAADMASVATRQCVQFMGGFGYSREYPVERMMRDAKMNEVYGGAMAKQKALIAAEIGVS